MDPIFNHNLDEDFDFRSSGITRSSFCSVYLDWIQFCYEKRIESHRTKQSEPQAEEQKSKSRRQSRNLHRSQTDNLGGISRVLGVSPRSINQTPSPRASESDENKDPKQQIQPVEIASRF